MLARHVIELVDLRASGGVVLGISVMLGIVGVMLVGVVLRGIRGVICVMLRPVSFGRIVMVGRVISGVVMLGIVIRMLVVSP